jgi:hypothetical protein
MSANDGIQFDHAEFENAPAQSTCADCQRPLAGFYYEANGQTVCESCRYAIETRFNSGSRAGRFLRATGLGLVAAALGFGIYYGIAALTGYEFGLIAIVVGFLVGTAVRIGSHGRGGWVYQTLAIALTYLAIVSTYIPPLIEGLREAAKREEAQIEQQAPGPAPAAAPAQASTIAAPAQSANTAAASPDATPTLAQAVFAIAILLAIACAAPFLAGFQNIIGIVIIGIGIYEAWKLNRRAELIITGPHTIAAAAAAASGA